MQLQAASEEAQELRPLLRSLQSELAQAAEERETLREQLKTAKDAARPPLPPGKVSAGTLDAVLGNRWMYAMVAVVNVMAVLLWLQAKLSAPQDVCVAA